MTVEKQKIFPSKCVFWALVQCQKLKMSSGHTTLVCKYKVTKISAPLVKESSFLLTTEMKLRDSKQVSKAPVIIQKAVFVEY